MLIEYLFFLLLGILLGVITGLTPGLHVNTIGMLMLSLFFTLNLTPMKFAILLCSMATVHTFLDFLPSIFLGAPEESTALSVLPTHRMLLQGRGLEAVKITGIASLYGVFMSIALLAVAFFFSQIMYAGLRSIMAPVLITASMFLLLRERKPRKILWALAAFLLSGYLGYVCLNRICALSTHQIFFPLFSGLFGISTLLLAVREGSQTYPQDMKAGMKLGNKQLASYSLLGAFGGLLVGVLPAVSPSQIGIMFQEVVSLKGRAKQRLEDLEVRKFLTIVASLNTADAMFSIFSLYLISNPRSGVSVIIQDLFGEVSLELFLVFALTMVVSGAIAYFIHLRLGYLFSLYASRVDFKKLCIMALLLVVLMVGLLTGPLGLLIMSASTLIGLVPALAGISRTHSMGCLLIPSIIFFLGL